MAAKPLTSEAIALTEKKMNMALDDIIKMNKKPTMKANNQRTFNKSQRSFNAAGQGNSLKMRRFMESRSSLRQGALAQRRSNYQGNQFPVTTEAARKAATAPIRNRPYNRSRMDNHWNKPRVGFRPVQRRVDVGFVAGKKQNQQAKMVPKQRPQTLDSLFANMKEQRMRVQQNTTRRDGPVGYQPRQGGRGRFGYFTS
ncbi:ribosome maturation factor [Thalictrum thalictroides]|uniref:Ribosome maturation factor n=1 Tax=Thalictrum thalictroides TaxID=46969 RepID=A0A7J6XE02_THATH|nr:ribosome maturation factor [Thalictrum thalictroides]